MKLEVSDNEVINSIRAWQDELIEGDIVDEIIYNTLETVIDLIIEGE